MTFCLGINVHDGLVGIADTRIVAGRESLVAKKVATYEGPGFSFFVMNSGLRSLRDKVLLYFEEAYAKQISARERLFKIVNLYSAQVRRLAEEDGKALLESDLRFNIHTLIGGQMAADSQHRLFLVYPEGNWVEIGPDTPYQIIGNSGYGKPILERSLTESDSLHSPLNSESSPSTRPGFALLMSIFRWTWFFINATAYGLSSTATSERTCATSPTGGRSACGRPWPNSPPSGLSPLFHGWPRTRSRNPYPNNRRQRPIHPPIWNFHQISGVPHLALD